MPKNISSARASWIREANGLTSVEREPRGAANPSLGSTGCQPVVVGSLPTTAQTARNDTLPTNFQELFGRLPKRTGWQPVLPRNYRARRHQPPVTSH